MKGGINSALILTQILHIPYLFLPSVSLLTFSLQGSKRKTYKNFRRYWASKVYERRRKQEHTNLAPKVSMILSFKLYHSEKTLTDTKASGEKLSKSADKNPTKCPNKPIIRCSVSWRFKLRNECQQKEKHLMKEKLLRIIGEICLRNVRMFQCFTKTGYCRIGWFG